MTPGCSPCGATRCCAGPTSWCTTGCRWRRCSTWRRRRAERISVGKAPGRVTMPQERDQRAARRAGSRGARPSCGSRAATRSCSPAAARRPPRSPAAGVPFEVVPGITSAIAVPAYAGIPVTLRHSSTSFTVVTGHEDPSAGDDGHGRLAGRGPGRRHDRDPDGRGPASRRIAEELIAGGLLARHAGGGGAVGHPARAAHRAGHAGHHRRPAARDAVGDRGGRGGRRRPRPGSSGGRCSGGGSSSPARASRRRSSRAALRDARRRADRGAGHRDRRSGRRRRRAAGRRRRGSATYDWVVVTSPNGADAACSPRVRPTPAPSAPRRSRPSGPAPRPRSPRGNVRADLVPERFVAEALLDALPAGPGRVLLARAEVARDVLPDGLRGRGWDVDVVDAYRTVAGGRHRRAARAAVAAADVVTFTSSSTVEHVPRRVRRRRPPAGRRLHRPGHRRHRRAPRPRRRRRGRRSTPSRPRRRALGRVAARRR